MVIERLCAGEPTVKVNASRNHASLPPAARLFVSRRAVALVAMVLVLAMMHLVVVGSLGPSRDDADLMTMRVETLRAFYAAELGAQIVLRSTLDESGPLAVGTEIALEHASVTIEEWPQDGQGRVVVEGRSGRSMRRVALELE